MTRKKKPASHLSIKDITRMEKERAERSGRALKEPENVTLPAIPKSLPLHQKLNMIAEEDQSDSGCIIISRDKNPLTFSMNTKRMSLTDLSYAASMIQELVFRYMYPAKEKE